MGVAPLGVGRVAAVQVEPQVRLVVVDLVEGKGDAGAIQVAAGSSQLVDVVVVRGAAVCGAPGGLLVLLVSHVCLSRLGIGGGGGTNLAELPASFQADGHCGALFDEAAEEKVADWEAMDATVHSSGGGGAGGS